MVGACQQNSGIFLVRGGGAGQEICGVRQRARSEMPATKSPGLAAGSERDAGGAEAGLGAEPPGSGKITSKENAL